MALNEALNNYVSSPITEEELQQCSAYFKAVDLDNSGEIDVKELQAALRGDLGEFSESTTRNLIACFDKSGNGTIVLTEFIYLYRFLCAMGALFKEQDANTDGRIDTLEVQSALKLEGMELQAKLVKLLVDRLSPEGNGLALDGFTELRLTIGNLRYLFDETDIDGSGTVSIEEAIHAVNKETSSSVDLEELSKLFGLFDANNDGLLNWNEFLTLGFTSLVCENEAKAELKAAAAV